MFAHNPNTMSRLGLDCFQNPKGFVSSWTMVNIDVARTREVEGASSRKMSMHHVRKVVCHPVVWGRRGSGGFVNGRRFARARYASSL